MLTVSVYHLFPEPLTHPLFTSPSTFSRHASTLISSVKEGFITVGKHAPGIQHNLHNVKTELDEDKVGHGNFLHYS